MKEFTFTINYQDVQTTSVTFNIEFLQIFIYLSRVNEINIILVHIISSNHLINENIDIAPNI